MEMDKFKEVPVEEETKILKRRNISISGYEVLYEKWKWDGIKAESVIFIEEEVENLRDNELIEFVKNSQEIINEEHEITIKHSSGFVFVNFNFEIM
jgi:hypothetical protein